jgi:putative hemolysin
MDVPVTLLIMLLCLIAEGFFSGAEIGVVSADKMKLRQQAAKGSRGAKLALSMLKEPEWLLSTTLVGTNISVVTNTTMATALVIQYFGESASWLAIAIAAPLIWVFGEIVPKSVFQQRADTLTPIVIFPLKAASYLFWPVLIVFSFLSKLLTRLFGNTSENPFTLREQIITMLDMPAAKGDIEPAESEMIRRLFNFSEITVEEAMVPLIDVEAVDKSATRGEAMVLAAKHHHVRLPVYEERVDRVVGMLHVLNLLGLDPDQPISADVKPVRYVPGSMSSRELLHDFRREGELMAVVVDEFGGATGLVTIEDIMEEVVEDIEDEYDSKEKPTQWIRKLSDREYMVSARIEIDVLEEKLGIRLPEGNYVTLAGFLLGKAREVPAPGTVIDAEKVTFTVERAVPQAIQEVRIRIP